MKSILEADATNLIGRIYEAGLSFDAWPDALICMADLFGAREATLGAEATDGIPWIFSPRTDPSYMQLYADAYHPLNNAYHGMIRRGVGVLSTDTMLAPRDTWARSAFHNEWSGPQGYHTKLGGMLLAEDGWRTVLMLTGKDEFQDDDLGLLRVFAPHVRRAVQMNIRLAQGDLASATATGLLEQVAAGAFLVDGRAKVLRANAAAEQLIRQDRGLRLVQGTLSAERSADDALLRKLVGSSALGLSGDGVVTLAQASGPPLQLQVLPVRGEAPSLGSTQASAIVLDITRRAPADPLDRLRAKYGFTAAEAAFALEIARGDGKQAAADRRGVSFATARTHLSRIFEKTGVHRQAELVRLLFFEIEQTTDA